VIPLVALIQSVARLELEGGEMTDPPTPEVLEENRFIAARDGLEARLIDPSTRRLVPARAIVHELYERCRPHARALGCSAELERVQRLAVANGADRQRAWARSGGVVSVVPKLIERF
jgi:glutamate---cysteine ligase / carboxylate-amine ligase